MRDVNASGGNQFHQRVRWWSALALLRSLASSPRAAATTLRNRASTVSAETPEEADEIGQRTVFDMTDDENPEGMDVAPGSDAGEEVVGGSNRRQLLEMARIAKSLKATKTRTQEGRPDGAGSVGQVTARLSSALYPNC